MNILRINLSKTLKLTNILQYECIVKDEDFNFNVAVEQMKTYIRTKGAKQVGPLIQYTKSEIDEADKLDIKIILLMQCDNFIHKTEVPYSMKQSLRVTNCIYCNYIGPEDKLKFAYDKIGVEAFENEILLQNDSYTVFINKCEDDNYIVADVFVERIN